MVTVTVTDGHRTQVCAKFRQIKPQARNSMTCLNVDAV